MSLNRLVYLVACELRFALFDAEHGESVPAIGMTEAVERYDLERSVLIAVAEVP